MSVGRLYSQEDGAINGCCWILRKGSDSGGFASRRGGGDNSPACDAPDGAHRCKLFCNNLYVDLLVDEGLAAAGSQDIEVDEDRSK